MKKTAKKRRSKASARPRDLANWPFLSAQALVDVSGETAAGRTKFPKNAKMLAALMEEVGELARALLQRKPVSEVRKEALQVASVALRIYEEGDADFKHGKWGDAP